MFPGKKLDYRGIGIVEVGIPLSAFETSKITLLLLVQHQIFSQLLRALSMNNQDKLN